MITTHHLCEWKVLARQLKVEPHLDRHASQTVPKISIICYHQIQSRFSIILLTY